MKARPTHHLNAYAPKLLIDLLRQGKLQRQAHAAALNLDISGFTAMTERFAAQGNAGAEELTAIINSFFTGLMGVVEAWGGDVVGFGGDSMSVLFCSTPARAAATVRRAWGCANALKASAVHLGEVQTTLGLFSLRIKIGLSFGALVAHVLSDESGQSKFLVNGPVMKWAAQSCPRASAGQIVVHPSARGYLAQHSAATKIQPRKPAKPAHKTIPNLVAFVAPSLVERLQQGASELINEHRNISVLFVRFAPSSDASAIAQAMTQVHAFGGCVARLDADANGSRLLALFGAPVMHEDNAARAVECALALQTNLRRRVRCGIGSGFLFCGDVGSPHRREYTVMGDAVNLAARLMQAAPAGQVFACPVTQQLAAHQFVWQPTQPMHLKGKSQPIVAHRPKLKSIAISPVQITPTEFLGRTYELTQLKQALGEAMRGTPQWVSIEAEAGMGKTQLAAQLMAYAQAQGCLLVATACQPHGQAPYALWQNILRGAMGVDGVDGVDVGSDVQTWLAAYAPQLQARLALLAPMLGLPMPEAAWVNALDRAQRRAMLADAVAEILQACAKAQPLLVVIDDAHWMDEGSRELLHDVQVQGRAMRSLVLVLSRGQESDSYKKSDSYRKIVLGELSAADALRLAQTVASSIEKDSRVFTNQELSELAQRGQGNPFFIEQLVRFAFEKRDAKLKDLPNSLRSLLVQRIDQLSGPAQSLLKIASVIGPTFNPEWVCACWLGRAPITPNALNEQVVALRTLDLLRPSDDLDANIAFRHATLREAAYEMLSFGTRERLHERIGLHIEARYAKQEAQWMQTLAHHFGHSKNTSKQRVYFRKAGDAAHAVFANDLAIAHYTRVLPLLNPAEGVPVLLGLGEAQAHVGAWAQAEIHFRHALHQAEAVPLPAQQAQAQNALGRLLARSQSYAESARWLQAARQAYEKLDDPTNLCNTLTHLGFAQLELGQLDLAEETVTAQMQIAQAMNDVTGMASAQQTLGQLATQRGEWAKAQKFLQLAQQLAGQSNDPRPIMLIENDIATLAWRRGDDRAAFEHFASALAVAQRIGFKAWVGVLLGNLGVLFWEWGVWPRAEACLDDALKIAKDLGDQTSELTCLGNKALLLRDVGETDAAQRMFADAITLGQQLGLPYYLCDHACSAAEMAFEVRDFSHAENLMAQAEQAAELADDDEVRFRLRLLRWQLDEAMRCISTLHLLLQLRRWLAEVSDDEQRASLLDQLWQRTTRKADALRAAKAYRILHQQRPRQRYRRKLLALGVADVSVPAWVTQLAELSWGD